jgi:glycerophosphoryl diester phosphodiesterase
MRNAKPLRRELKFIVDKPIAHRGLHEPFRCIIENTPGAFEAAITAGYAIECDLQLTGDGEAVVFHDDTVGRLMEAKGAIGQHTATQLRALKFKQCNDRIQTLHELLEQVAGRAVLVIELKSHWNGNVDLVRRAIQCVEQYKGPFCMMSFDPDMVEALRALAPKIVRGITADKALDPYYDHLPLARRTELRHFGHLARTAPHFVSYDFHDLPAPHVDQVRAAGYPVITWTIRSKSEAKMALRHSDQMTFEGFRP